MTMENNSLHKVDRSRAVLKNGNGHDDDFVDAPPESLVDFAWQLSAELYSLRGIDAESRLQRNVANLVRQRG